MLKTATPMDANVIDILIKGVVCHLEIKKSIHLFKNADKLVHGEYQANSFRCALIGNRGTAYDSSRKPKTIYKPTALNSRLSNQDGSL